MTLEEAIETVRTWGGDTRAGDIRQFRRVLIEREQGPEVSLRQGKRKVWLEQRAAEQDDTRGAKRKR